ncbi:10835_t:CDS:2 [Paraglomus brasilianum]|uniref:10835_t:CDS:1 n=1 Tax=Paraglomus brasilianum TaxID=144538 RepID=A0A9N9B1S3_9GLOM|nr:10835_t:CDS:2 [Paraglomus brasilianum]
MSNAGMSVTRPSHCIVSTVRDAQFDEMLCILVASESAVCRIHSTNRAYARDAVSNNLYRGTTLQLRPSTVNDAKGENTGRPEAAKSLLSTIETHSIFFIHRERPRRSTAHYGDEAAALYAELDAETEEDEEAGVPQYVESTSTAAADVALATSSEHIEEFQTQGKKPRKKKRLGSMSYGVKPKKRKESLTSNFRGRDLVFVNPLDKKLAFWWPAMVVPSDEVDESMTIESLGEKECIVKYFEDDA